MNITISRSLLLLGVFVMAGMAVSMGIMIFTLEKLKIAGPDYVRIVDAKDLIADILPPPLYVIEPYLLANETLADKSRAAESAKRFKVLKQGFDARMQYWEKSSLATELRDGLHNDLGPISATFWSELEDKFIPAANSGNLVRMSKSLDRLREDYVAQEAAVNRLVALSDAYYKRIEAEANADAFSLQAIAFTAAGIAVLMLLGGLYIFRRRAISPLIGIGHYMGSLAQGDFETEVPFLKRRDEIGAMSKALSVFRAAGQEKLRLQAEKLRMDERTEADRARRAEEAAHKAVSLQKVVADLGAGLDRLSKLNIRMTLDEPFAPEFEILRNDFNASLAVFQETMLKVLEKSQEIDQSSRLQQNAADQLAKRTEQQAAALEETAAALEEITINVKTSTQRTNSTRENANTAKGHVEKSSEIVQDAIVAMGKIEEASKEIGNITSVIDEIAFQTNLLALNAGVEAARAGEAGRGFAVVAHEVRELAQRSAKAAKEISSLIQRSNREVADGVGLVRKTGDALRDIETSINGIATDITAIASSASEQASGLSEVNNAINQMDHITQQNAAMVEESTASTHKMAEQVEQLGSLVGQFVFNRRTMVRDTKADNDKTQQLRGKQFANRAA